MSNPDIARASTPKYSTEHQSKQQKFSSAWSWQHWEQMIKLKWFAVLCNFHPFTHDSLNHTVQHEFLLVFEIFISSMGIDVNNKGRVCMIGRKVMYRPVLLECLFLPILGIIWHLLIWKMKVILYKSKHPFSNKLIEMPSLVEFKTFSKYVMKSQIYTFPTECQVTQMTHKDIKMYTCQRDTYHVDAPVKACK